MERSESTTPHDAAAYYPPIVAVFDTVTMARRTVAELQTLAYDELWLAVVRGETDGETTVACDGGEEVVLSRALVGRGTSEEEACDFDGRLPPGTAVMSLRIGPQFDEAIRIIEVTGGHIEHL